jgi:type I restriction enzyme S subunit
VEGGAVNRPEATALAKPLRRFKPYPAYKDSGVEWLGEIPAHWQVKRLKYVAAARISKLEVKPDDAVYVGLEHVESWTGRLLLGNQPETVDSVVGSFRAGDVLFGKLRPYLAKVARPDFDGVFTSEILPLRPVPECSQSYVMYELLNAPYIRWLDSLTYGTKMPRVSPDQVASSFVGLSPLPEQRAIAAFLDRETARIDALVAKKERLIELLQEQRTALITRAVTKGLDPTVPMKDSGVEWLGQIPAHWEVKRIKFIAQVGSGSTPNRDNAEYWGGEYPWLNSSVVNHHEVTEAADFVTALALAECHLPRVLPPAVLVGITDEGRTRGMATVLRVEATLSQHLAFIRLTSAYRDVEYIRYVFHSPYQFLRDESGGGGSTKGALTCEQLGNMAIPFPPAAEQRAIAAFLDRETARIDALIAKVREAIERLKELRTALISAAVTGKIDVREEVAT